MGTTKKDQFTKEQNHLATMAKAIGHPARIAILEYLFKMNACICGDIVNEIGLAQSTVSQHLKALKDGEIDGARVCYCINKENFSKISNALTRFFKTGSCFDCC